MTLKSPLNAALDSRKHPATRDYRKLEKKIKKLEFATLYKSI